jgi:hypothetical protein
MSISGPGLRAQPPAPPPRAVTWRSVGLGLAGAVFIAAFTPFNDFVASNTFMIGSALPTSVVFILMVMVLLNALLRRLVPRRALTTPEMAVILGMLLVACSLPSVGWFRYLPGHLVQHFNLTVDTPDFQEMVEQMELPDWLFPVLEGATAQEKANDPVIQEFIGRAWVEEPTFRNRLAAVPWGAWLRPAITWGVFTALVMGSALCLVLIFRRQWVENERLPFPLASIYLSLLEPPSPARGLNRLLSSRSFWIAAATVFALHGLNALNKYNPNWPAVPLEYDLTTLLAEEPWASTTQGFKVQPVYFTIIGVLFLAETRVSLSIWVIYVASQVVRMWLGRYGQTITGGMQQDQMLGAVVVLGMALLVIGRQHLRAVVGQMFRRPRAGEPQGRYVPYSAAGWGLLVCMVGMVAWMVAAGMTVAGAMLVVAILMLSYIVLGRLVAETGLIYPLLPIFFTRPWLYLANLPGGVSVRTSMETYYFSGLFSGQLTHDFRESLTVYGSHALRVADGAFGDQGEKAGPRGAWRRLWPFAAVLVLTLVVVYAVAGASVLWCNYTFAATLHRTGEAPVDWWGTEGMQRWYSVGPTTQYLPPRSGPAESHSRIGHFAFGGGAILALTLLRIRLPGWPLHPVGFLLVNSWVVDRIWFSILLAWLAKSVIVRFGGAGLYADARPFFIGLIIGEAMAAAFWLIVSVVRLSMGLDYERITVLLS